MGARNVHKDDVTIFKLPQDAIQEDRGLNTCNVPQKVLASTADAISYKNDRTAIAYKFDSMTIQLEDSNGALTSAAGVAVSFPYQSDAVGFVIDWRQVVDGGGQLIQGCYRVRVNWSLAGNSGWFYHGAYQLLEYSVDNAKGTTRLYVVLNDLVRKQGINYKDSGFAGTVRFDGIFGFMQPNYDTENNIHTDRTRYKVRNEALRTYELRTSYLNRCATRLIDEDTLLAANQIYVTDHNAANHDRYYDFPVILSEEESPSFEYPIGSVFAKITAKFLDKVAYHESKYDGNIAGSENVILTLPTVTSSCADATITLDSAALATVPSGGTFDAELVDQNGATITPTSIVSGVITVDQTPPTSQTGMLMKSGEAADTRGRAGDFDTLGKILLDVDGNQVLNGTLERFVDTTGAQTYTDGIIIDRSTFDTETGEMLGYYVVNTSATTRTYATGLAEAQAVSIGSFTSGWDLVSLKEFESIQNTGVSGAGGIFYHPFDNYYTSTGIKFFLTRSEVAGSSTNFWVMRETASNLSTSKTLSITAAFVLASRVFTWNGTILT